MFSGIFSSLSVYIILGLAASTASFGWLSVHNYRAKVEAESALVVAINANTGLQTSLNLKDKSCQINDTDVVEVEAEKKQVDEVVSPINAKLKDLATVKRPVTYVAQPNRLTPKQNETTKDESNFLPDDGLLSPNVTRLLNDGWCSVYPSTSQCFPSEQPTNKPV